MHILVDIFLAGAETTSTTLTWGILYMIREVNVQRKVQEELDRVVGEYNFLILFSINISQTTLDYDKSKLMKALFSFKNSLTC